MADFSEDFEMTAPGVMLYPNLMEAKAFVVNGKPVGDPKFSLNLRLAPDHVDLLPMKRLCAKLAKDKWAGRDLKTSGLSFPFTDGTVLADAAKAKVDAGVKGAKLCEYNRGFVIVPCRSKFQPVLACFVNGKPLDLTTAELKTLHAGKFFMGAEFIGMINFLAYDRVNANGQDGVTARLNMVAVTGKGDRIGNQRSAAEMLRGVAGHSSMEDPTAGDNDPGF